MAFSLLVGILLLGCTNTQRRMERIRSDHPDWNQETIQRLARSKVEPGMTREMVHAALGEPDAIFREDGEEVWGYAAWIVTYSLSYERLVYFVHFREDKVVRTRGDVNRIRTLI
jgi:outer membrane protein assembly factor BamE (lipoprotein component of BamABCDE complex)